MSDKSKIAWTEATWNVVTGCSKVSAGCKHCYADREWPRLSANSGTVYYGRSFTDVAFHPERLSQPLGWKRPRRIFVNSMSDLFHESLTNEQIMAVFGVMTMAHEHQFQVLTKRPERMLLFMKTLEASQRGPLSNVLAEAVVTTSGVAAKRPLNMKLATQIADKGWPLPNVWLGVSVEDQATANVRIPLLLQTPAAVRWVSYEPALGPVDFRFFLGSVATATDPSGHGIEWTDHSGPFVDWIVVGGESGPKARPFYIEWARSTIKQCRATNTGCFVKQLGAAPHYDTATSWANRLTLKSRAGADSLEWPEDLRVRVYPEVK